MDIHSKKLYPSNELSNFAHHRFIFDGVVCESMEGLLQSLKIKTHRIQKELCQMTGIKVKRRGTKRNKFWKERQRLWWKGKEYDRHGREYQDLLDRAFDALSENEDFKKALLDTENSRLTHKIGESDPSKTVLTEKEFCSRLHRIRKRLRKRR